MTPNHYMDIDGETWFNDFRTMMWISQGVAGPCWACPELADVFISDLSPVDPPTCQIVGGVIYCETDCNFGFTSDVTDDNYELGTVCPERYCPQINGTDPAVWSDTPTDECGRPAPWYDPTSPVTGRIAGYIVKSWEWFTPFKEDNGADTPRVANVSVLVAADGADATCAAVEALYRRLAGFDGCTSFTSQIFKTCDPTSARTLCGGRLVPGSWNDTSVPDLQGYNFETNPDTMPRCCGARIEFSIEFSDPCAYGPCIEVAGPVDIVENEAVCYRPGDGCCDERRQSTPCLPNNFGSIAPPPPISSGPFVEFGTGLQPYTAFIENFTLPDSMLGLPKWAINLVRSGDDSFSAQNPFRQTAIKIWCADDLTFLPSFDLEAAMCVTPVWSQKAMILPQGSANVLDPVCGGIWSYQCVLEDAGYTTEPANGNHLWVGNTVGLLEPGKTYHAAVMVDVYGMPGSIQGKPSIGDVVFSVQTKDLS